MDYSLADYVVCVYPNKRTCLSVGVHQRSRFKRRTNICKKPLWYVL